MTLEIQTLRNNAMELCFYYISLCNFCIISLSCINRLIIIKRNQYAMVCMSRLFSIFKDIACNIFVLKEPLYMVDVNKEELKYVCNMSVFAGKFARAQYKKIFYIKYFSRSSLHRKVPECPCFIKI